MAVLNSLAVNVSANRPSCSHRGTGASAESDLDGSGAPNPGSAAAAGPAAARLVSLGRYALKGVARPQEMFTLDPE